MEWNDWDVKGIRTHLQVLLEQALAVDELVVLLPASLDAAPGQLHLLLLPPRLELGQQQLLGVVDHLLADHDDGQLLGQLDQTAASTTLQAQPALSSDQTTKAHNRG